VRFIHTKYVREQLLVNQRDEVMEDQGKTDRKRRQRTVSGVNTWYNWGLGWDLLNEESRTGSGTLQKTYVSGMGEIAGSSPTTGARRMGMAPLPLAP
jgi:hypothetical protein